MFGFLRRKKEPAASPASPAAAPAPSPAAAAPVPAALASPPPGSGAATPAPAVAAPAQALASATTPEPTRTGWLARLKQGLSRTRGNLAGLFGVTRIDETLFEELETALLVSDAGVETTAWLLDTLRRRVKEQRLTDGAQVREALRALLVEVLAPLERPIDIDRAAPLVMMIAGVNGAGKTTSIGKLAHHLQREGKSILLAAGDTFRAAAREQLAQWGERNGVQVIAQQGGDPAAVAYDSVSAGQARQTGVVIIDTAGRLPTQSHLMDELRKIHRVLGKAMPGAPHETLLVLDGNTGQNMLAQVRAFDEAVGLTGLIVTKLDGTAKGGALAALAHTRRERPIPVYFIGVGEGLDDLQAFSAAEFASALLDS
jgi:fused signal recognition particle receptor